MEVLKLEGLETKENEKIKSPKKKWILHLAYLLADKVYVDLMIEEYMQDEMLTGNFFSRFFTSIRILFLALTVQLESFFEGGVWRKFFFTPESTFRSLIAITIVIVGAFATGYIELAKVNYSHDLAVQNSENSKVEAEKYKEDLAIYEADFARYQEDLAIYEADFARYQEDLAIYEADFARYQEEVVEYKEKQEKYERELVAFAYFLKPKEDFIASGNTNVLPVNISEDQQYI